MIMRPVTNIVYFTARTSEFGQELVTIWFLKLVVWKYLNLINIHLLKRDSDRLSIACRLFLFLFHYGSWSQGRDSQLREECVYISYIYTIIISRVHILHLNSLVSSRVESKWSFEFCFYFTAITIKFTNIKDQCK